MANPEHLEIIEQGFDVWNDWRRKNPEVLVDLSGASLFKLDFYPRRRPPAILTNVNLSRALLMQANLHSADLTGANLTEANLGEANLDSAVLTRANLSGAYLCGVNFTGAELCEADLTSVILGWTVFGNTDLTNAKGLELCRHFTSSIIDHQTLMKSGKLPLNFLRGCGLPDTLIEYIPSLLNDPLQFYSCFISYSSNDQDFAERLHADLQNKGVRCWFAPEDLKIGAEIRTGIDESIRLHDKLLLVLSETSVKSRWVEQEVETALAKEREQGRTVLFPIRLDDAVLRVSTGWPAYLKNTRNIGDFTRWKDHDAFSRAFERLLRGLKSDERDGVDRLTQDALLKRAVLSPRNTITEEWDKVEELIIQLAKRVGLIKGEGLVDCGRLINQMHEAGRISMTVREKFFTLSKMHLNTTFNSFLPVEPATAVGFANDAIELQKALTVDTSHHR